MKTTFLSLLILICSMAVFPCNGLAQDSRPIVRLIYFLPKDREPQPDIDTHIDSVIKEVQQFYADQMEAHGYGRKTFQFETDANGNAVVHHMKGQFNDEYYPDYPTGEVSKEIEEQLDTSKDIFLVAVDTSRTQWCGVSTGSSGRMAFLRAPGVCVRPWVAAHELGHAFGLEHDYRNIRHVMHIGQEGLPFNQIILSHCTAEWLDVHSHFNAHQTQTVNNASTTIEILPPNLVSPPNVIRLRFEITDADKLHQAQLLLSQPTGFDLIGCKRLNTKSSTIEFVTTVLTPRREAIHLEVIDAHGDITLSVFPIDITSVLPPSTVVSIPDANLASAIAQEIGNPITTHTILNLTGLNGSNRGITDLTGLEHAHSLIILDLGAEFTEDGFVNNNKILDTSALSGLTQLEALSLRNTPISDISPLARLKQLRHLNLTSTNVSDISALSDLTQLETLGLPDTPISDISPLARLKQLRFLVLIYTKVSDISVLSDLTQLATLALSGTPISDISPLARLTQLTHLQIFESSISDISPLTELTQLTHLNLFANYISDVSVLVGLTQLTHLDLSRNPLNYASINTYIPAMQAKGIEVQFDNRAHSALVKISGDGQEGIRGAALATPFVVEAMDPQGKPMQGVPVTFAVTAGVGNLSTTTAITDATGKAQTTLTLGRSPGKNIVTAAAPNITPSRLTFTAAAVGEPVQLTMDVNADGVVNIQDMVLVLSNFGQTGQNSADVNSDGVVNIQDLVLVAGNFGSGTAAPTLQPSDIEGLTTAKIQDLLTQARQTVFTDPAYLRGIVMLEQLLTALIPKETDLLHNYPNPFNPETWIPYQLSEPTDVTLHIYAVDGRVVRQLTLGHQPAGMYHSKSRAAYWDGRNEQGEHVASGVYFYTLSAGNFSATRKMLIRK